MAFRQEAAHGRAHDHVAPGQEFPQVQAVHQLLQAGGGLAVEGVDAHHQEVGAVGLVEIAPEDAGQGRRHAFDFGQVVGPVRGQIHHLARAYALDDDIGLVVQGQAHVLPQAFGHHHHGAHQEDDQDGDEEDGQMLGPVPGDQQKKEVEEGATWHRRNPDS